MMCRHAAGPIINSKRWSTWRFLVIIPVATVFSQCGSGHAQQASPELPTEPILRIEAGQHVGQILRIDTDAANKFVVTASWDKTVRVWSLPDGRLQRILRLPIDYGDIGKAYGVAISPDGGTVAVGGWTGAHPHHNIFLFDRASGALKQRLPDLPNVINHLTYSADGRRLAASLARSNGIRVYDAFDGYRLLPSDTQYGDGSYRADPKLTLYVLAIGISNYKDKHVNLHFAAKDADDFVEQAKTQEGEGKLYEKVITHPPHGSLRDEEATREAVRDELDWIKRAVTNTNDVAMIFLSGHGVTTPDQHYRFLPYDYDSNRVERTTISDSELQDYLTKIGGKKIFFFDTCYSGAILGGKATNPRPTWTSLPMS